MAYVRKTHDEWTIEQYWGDNYGWERVSGSESRDEAQSLFMDYLLNQPEIPVRLCRRRIKNDKTDVRTCV